MLVREIDITLRRLCVSEMEINLVNLDVSERRRLTIGSSLLVREMRLA